MIDRETVDKILNAVDIVDVIGDFLSLKRRGSNYIACCPFHNEKTPSFSVSPSKGIFKCFGCGKAGSAITFVMEHEQMTYPEALKYLARKYGIEIHEKEQTPEDIAKNKRRESLLIVSEYAQRYYADILFNSKVGRAVGLSYFKQVREFSEETIKKFGLGFAPNPHMHNGSEFFKDSVSDAPILSLSEAAQKAGYKSEFLLDTGLCVIRNDGKLADRFYDRVMFPIHSLSGRVIAFGGRTLRKDKSVAKYVNSRETDIYVKNKSLYGIYFAKSSINKLDKCYLVEGYTDVISFHQAGVENVVASSGTSLTVNQIRLIKRFTNHITVLYDGDSAGIKASLRGINLILKEGLQVKVALFPEGHDPDSFARTHTKEEIVTFLNEQEKDFIDFKYELLSKDISNDPMRKVELIKEIVNTIAIIPDPIIRSVYIEQTSKKLDIEQDILTEEVSKVHNSILLNDEKEKRLTKERKNRFSKTKYSSYRQDNSSSSPREIPPIDNIPPDINDIPPAIDNIPYEYSSIEHTQNNYSIVAPLVEASEKDIIYYLLKFGESIIHFEQRNASSEVIDVINITVSNYIKEELEQDDLEILNPLYRKIYNLYYEFLEESTPGDDIQERIQTRFNNYEDQEITKKVLSIIIDDYKINVKEYKKSLIPEENLLHINVPRAIVLFKYKYTEHVYNNLIKELHTAQDLNDNEKQLSILSEINTQNIIKNKLSKALKRI
ncbi:MAG: DNA primase [Bacteroidales bacterium]